MHTRTNSLLRRSGPRFARAPGRVRCRDLPLLQDPAGWVAAVEGAEGDTGGKRCRPLPGGHRPPDSTARGSATVSPEEPSETSATLKRPENLNEQQAVKMAELLRYNLKTMRAYLVPGAIGSYNALSVTILERYLNQSSPTDSGEEANILALSNPK